MRHEPKQSNDNRIGKNTAVWCHHLEKNQTEEVGAQRNSIPEDPLRDSCESTAETFLELKQTNKQTNMISKTNTKAIGELKNGLY